MPESDLPYEINLEEKFGKFTLIDIPAEVAACTDEWFSQTLTTVNDAVVRLGIVKGEFHWHTHEDEDEFFLVLDGQLLLDIEDQDTVVLDRHQAYTVPRGVLTRMSEMAMWRAGIDPSVIYAWHKTGLVVTERNQHLLTADDWQDWLDAIFEYECEAICLHLQEAHGRDSEAAAVEAGSIFADHGDRICPYCGQHLQYPESAWD
jgi:hypothetical protein